MVNSNLAQLLGIQDLTQTANNGGVAQGAGATQTRNDAMSASGIAMPQDQTTPAGPFLQSPYYPTSRPLHELLMPYAAKIPFPALEHMNNALYGVHEPDHNFLNLYHPNSQKFDINEGPDVPGLNASIGGMTAFSQPPAPSQNGAIENKVKSGSITAPGTAGTVSGPKPDQNEGSPFPWLNVGTGSMTPGPQTPAPSQTGTTENKVKSGIDTVLGGVGTVKGPKTDQNVGPVPLTTGDIKGAGLSTPAASTDVSGLGAGVQLDPVTGLPINATNPIWRKVADLELRLKSLKDPVPNPELEKKMIEAEGEAGNLSARQQKAYADWLAAHPAPSPHRMTALEALAGGLFSLADRSGTAGHNFLQSYNTQNEQQYQNAMSQYQAQANQLTQQQKSEFAATQAGATNAETAYKLGMLPVNAEITKQNNLGKEYTKLVGEARQADATIMATAVASAKNANVAEKNYMGVLDSRYTTQENKSLALTWLRKNVPTFSTLTDEGIKRIANAQSSNNVLDYQRAQQAFEVGRLAGTKADNWASQLSADETEKLSRAYSSLKMAGKTDAEMQTDLAALPYVAREKQAEIVEKEGQAALANANARKAVSEINRQDPQTVSNALQQYQQTVDIQESLINTYNSQLQTYKNPKTGGYPLEDDPQYDGFAVIRSRRDRAMADLTKLQKGQGATVRSLTDQPASVPPQRNGAAVSQNAKGATESSGGQFGWLMPKKSTVINSQRYNQIYNITQKAIQGARSQSEAFEMLSKYYDAITKEGQ